MSCSSCYIVWFIIATGIIFYFRKFLNKYKQSQIGLKLNGKHVLVTGGSSGIGKSVAKLAFCHGASVTILARSSEKLEKAASEISAVSGMGDSLGKVQHFSVDVSKDHDEVEKVIKLAESSFGHVDLLVCCAGTSMSGRFEDIPISDFKNLLDVNYLGTVYTIKGVLPQMKARKDGRIVLVSSICGVFGLYGFTAYSGSKFALRGLAEALHMEVSSYGVSVTLSLPPDTDTPGFEEEQKTKPIETKLISESGGLISPDEVAHQLLIDALAGNFFSTVGLEGKMIALVCAGTAPITDLCQLVSEVVTMGFLRAVIAVFLLRFKQIVKRCMKQRDQDKKAE